MKRLAVLVFLAVLLSCVKCKRQSRHPSVGTKSMQHFDDITANWHHKLRKTMDKKVSHLQIMARNTLAPSTHQSTNPNDIKAMTMLYTATNGKYWYNSTRWMKGDPCDNQWHGLYCINGRVIQINLVFNNMTGSLPADLALADMLQVVRFYSNRLTGSIPAELLKMKSLQILDLDSNLLTGTVPSSISMPNLTSLILYHNQLKGHFPDLDETPLLQTLEISSNSFIGDFPDVSGCTDLQVLVASRNNFSGEYPSNLGRLQNLRQLWLFTNQFNQPEIPNSWSGLISLQDIQLESVNGVMPSFIGEAWTKLVHLVMIDGTLTGGFDTALCNLEQLQDLRLFGNQLSGTLPTCVCDMRRVTIFEMSDNQLTGSIPYCIGSLSELTDFYLSRNNLTGTLPSSIGSLAKLEIIDVSSNSITGSVPSSYAGLTEVVGFSLCYNKLYELENGLEPLFNRIKGYSCELYNNPWSCPLPSDVPTSCGAVCSKCNTGTAHTECSECVADANCGWCNEGPNCLEGSVKGPYDYQCKSQDWSYGSGAC